MKIYLAGPIDAEADKGSGWRNELKNKVIEPGFVFFDPVAPYHFTSIIPAVSAYIHDINMFALLEADVVVARMMKNQSSIGTPIELYEAIKKNKPIILITDMDKSIYMEYISTKSIKVKTIEEAITAIPNVKLTASIKINPECPRDSMMLIQDEENMVPVGLRKLKFVGDK